ncbi:TetR/AcrR family transcriptional regulator [Streptomyces beihaiensis]|uniref:TetR/AcrR family transcriptional regulator n=1 Tax=Streptomyces beihaiensis TaxID=2984495 RepID=A0ABT3TPX4_9ACTN|nr:TetR/AcrR family transcriptional regulator [Streptomyces beihaiensis]MCX3059042.1 TetR/AcrR family transcriptional regulator [Streptomyces beihaiensis]
MAPTSQEAGRETRSRLLRAAAELIAEDGWGSVSTRRVAERAGVRPALVHYHFRSVDNLLIEAALSALREEMDGMLAGLREGADAGVGLAFFLEEIARYAAGGETTTLFSEMMLASTRHERLREELGKVLYECRAALARWVAGQRRALGEEPGDAEGTAVLLLALLDGLVLHRMIDPDLGSVPVTGALRRLAGLPEEP